MNTTGSEKEGSGLCEGVRKELTTERKNEKKRALFRNPTSKHTSSLYINLGDIFQCQFGVTPDEKCEN
jgi:hypothetical protein